jgi:hypothetical protein
MCGGTSTPLPSATMSREKACPVGDRNVPSVRIEFAPHPDGWIVVVIVEFQQQILIECEDRIEAHEVLLDHKFNVTSEFH